MTTRYNNQQKATAENLLKQVTDRLVSVFAQAKNKGYTSYSFKKVNGVSGKLDVKVIDQETFNNLTTNGYEIFCHTKETMPLKGTVADFAHNFAYQDLEHIQLDAMLLPYFFGMLLAAKLDQSNEKSNLNYKHYVHIGQQAEVRAAIQMGLTDLKL